MFVYWPDYKKALYKSEEKILQRGGYLNLIFASITQLKIIGTSKMKSHFLRLRNTFYYSRMNKYIIIFI